jgi:mitogen-activated protein kinase 1/3
LPKTKKVAWETLFPSGSKPALNMLDHLLQFDPELRLTVDEALSHPYLESYHDVEDEVQN